MACCGETPATVVLLVADTGAGEAGLHIGGVEVRVRATLPHCQWSRAQVSLVQVSTPRCLNSTVTAASLCADLEPKNSYNEADFVTKKTICSA